MWKSAGAGLRDDGDTAEDHGDLQEGAAPVPVVAPGSGTSEAPKLTEPARIWACPAPEPTEA